MIANETSRESQSLSATRRQVRVAVVQPGSILFDTPGSLEKLADLTRAKLDFDVVGHYARPDVFRLEVNEQPMKPVSFVQKWLDD